jgi:hypothetical protein
MLSECLNVERVEGCSKISARANIKNNFSRPVKPVQFMLNIFYHHKMRGSLLLFFGAANGKSRNIQLQEGKVAIAVVGLVLALLGDIFLEGGGGLRVVSVEAGEASSRKISPWLQCVVDLKSP